VTADSPYTEGFPTRHLLYYIAPVAENQTWQRNLDQLIPRLPLFTGKRIIGIAHGVCEGHGDGNKRPTLPPEYVVNYLAGHNCEFIVKPNDPQLREMVLFEDLFGRVAVPDPQAAVFFGQAKGVTRPVNPGVSVHPWTRMLYASCLDYWPLVAQSLAGYPVTGSFKKVGRAGMSSFHYSGSFYWLRADSLFSRDWRKSARDWWGIEQWPGIQCRAEEAGCLFHEGKTGRYEHGGMDLYHEDYITKVLDEFRAWCHTNNAYRRWA
jgi:hypothetical protein